MADSGKGGLEGVVAASTGISDIDGQRTGGRGISSLSR